MEIPFSFGKILSDENFTDRQEDVARLTANFNALTNTVLISPRRWGKSSMVRKALKGLPKDEFIVVEFDAFKSKDWPSFLQNYAVAINRAARTDNALSRFIASHIPSVNPRLTVSAGDVSMELGVEINLKKAPETVEEIMELPEKIATAKRKKVVVCIDEFQNIANFSETLAIQRTLRSYWQNHTHVAYCLFGSKFNIMTRLISKPKMPFYRFGDTFYLDKIDERHWVDFITSKFGETGKTIDAECAALIASLCENHPYYVQQLAQLTWLRTGSACTRATVTESFDSLVDQMSMQFIMTTSELTGTQLEFLRALCDGVTNFSSVDTLREYRIGTAPNVKNIRATLEKKEIITTFPKRTEIQDPIFKHWLIAKDR